MRVLVQAGENAPLGPGINSEPFTGSHDAARI
jgi:hypothetical protein